MAVFEYLLVPAGLLVVSFWTWVVLKIVGLEKDLVDLKRRVKGHDDTFEHWLVWLRSMDRNVRIMYGGLQRIGGKLEVRLPDLTGNGDDLKERD